ncbi:MAG: hypothetical protein ACYDEN_00355, partial [Acidimicrobiales bacterium]
MVRCAGCGAMVSEWAARCPVCLCSTADAEPVPPGPTDPGPPDNPGATDDSGATDDPGPADDPSQAAPAPPPAVAEAVPPAAQAPAPNLLATRLLAGVAAAMLVTASIAAVGSPAPGGRLVAATASGEYVTSTDLGTRVTPLPLLAGPGLVIARDGRFVATGTGNELRLQGNRLVPTGRSVTLKGPPGSWRAFDFADHDQALVAAETVGPTVGAAAIEVVTFSGQSTNLGSALAVAGDPQAPGIFAAVAGPYSNLVGGFLGYGGGATAVELLDAGKPPVVLAGTARLAAALDLPYPSPILLAIAPDPSGDKVAVAVSPFGSSRRGGIVVLSRSGRILGAVATPPVSL